MLVILGLFIVGIFLTSAAIYSEDVALFRHDYVYDSSSQTFFKQHEELKNFGEAVLTCEIEGSQLVTPLTQQELDTILAVKEKSEQRLWLGFHDLYNEGNFITLNGTPTTSIFMNWCETEPNQNGDEDCVDMQADGYYNDVQCTEMRGFICEKKTSSLSANPECKTYDTEYRYEPLADRCYKLHKHPASWHDAVKACSVEGAHLGIINSPDEAKIYVEIVKTLPINVYNQIDWIFLGFSDLIIEGSYRSISDGKFLEDVGYNEWRPGQPDNYNNEDCGTMYKEGQLNDLDCASKNLFICEKKLNKKVSVNIDIRFGKAV